MEPTRHALMTTAEVAEMLRRPVSTLRYWRHTGEGPHSFRLGRVVVYAREDVETWLEAQRSGTGDAA